MKELAQAFADFFGEYTALTHVEAHGWKNGVDQSGQPIGKRKPGHGSGGDPRAGDKRDEMEKRVAAHLTRSAGEIRNFLTDRQIEVDGCNPRDDCKPADTNRACGFLGAGGCRLDRR